MPSFVHRHRRVLLALLALAAAAGVTSTAATSPEARTRPSADTRPPSVPQGMAFSGRTRTTVSLVWNAASDDVGVAGYSLYLNGRRVARVKTLRYTYRGLRCGTSYTFALEAYDAAGNASYRPEAVGRTSTLRCAAAKPKPRAKPKPKAKPRPRARPRRAPAPRAGTAHLWVDQNGGSCARRGAPAAYADGRACGSLAAAYNAARPGDTVLVAAGVYGRQVLPRGDKAIAIRNAPGATPQLGTVEVHSSNLRLAGFRIVRTDDPGAASATLEIRGSRNVFDRVHVDSRNAPVRQGIHVDGDFTVLRNGSSFNVVDEKGALVGASNATFDNMRFHDVRVTHSSVHNECVYSNGPNLTVRNSRFWNCATMALFITRGDWWGQPVYGNVTLVNNVFGHTTNTGPGSWHYYSLGINGGVIREMRNWRVINNTFETAVGGEAPAPGTIWANNVGSWNCFSGATFSHNVGKVCAGSDRRVSPAVSCGRPACPNPTTAAQRWLNPAAHNFRLTAGSPAVNAADPQYAPRRDKDGKPRRGRPDAGAYEYR